ncbi:unnamed protein product [Amoebophrya sp. A25]|nr:unnamed protein product [Amoebophrya sp. A25]|eukprot:GSA25T00009608001.1
MVLGEVVLLNPACHRLERHSFVNGNKARKTSTTPSASAHDLDQHDHVGGAATVSVTNSKDGAKSYIDQVLSEEGRLFFERRLPDDASGSFRLFSAADHGFFWLPSTWTAVRVRFQKLGCHCSPPGHGHLPGHLQGHRQGLPEKHPQHYGDHHRTVHVKDAYDMQLLQGEMSAHLSESYHLRRTEVRKMNLAEGTIVLHDNSSSSSNAGAPNTNSSNGAEPTNNCSPTTHKVGSPVLGTSSPVAAGDEATGGMLHGPSPSPPSSYFSSRIPPGQLELLTNVVALSHPRWREFGFIEDLTTSEMFVYHVEDYSFLLAEVQSLLDVATQGVRKVEGLKVEGSSSLSGGTSSKSKMSIASRDRYSHNDGGTSSLRYRAAAGALMKRAKKKSVGGGAGGAPKMTKKNKKMVSVSQKSVSTKSKSKRSTTTTKKVQKSSKKTSRIETKAERHERLALAREKAIATHAIIQKRRGELQQSFLSLNAIQDANRATAASNSSKGGSTSSSTTKAKQVMLKTNGRNKGSGATTAAAHSSNGGFAGAGRNTAQEQLDDEAALREEGSAFLLHHQHWMSVLRESVNSRKHEDLFITQLLMKDRAAVRSEELLETSSTTSTLQERTTSEIPNTNNNDTKKMLIHPHLVHPSTSTQLIDMLLTQLAQWKALASHYQKFLLQSSRLNKVILVDLLVNSEANTNSTSNARMLITEAAAEHELGIFRNIILYVFRTLLNLSTIELQCGLFVEAGEHAAEASVLWCSMLTDHVVSIPQSCLARVDMAHFLERERQNRHLRTRSCAKIIIETQHNNDNYNDSIHQHNSSQSHLLSNGASHRIEAFDHKKKHENTVVACQARMARECRNFKFYWQTTLLSRINPLLPHGLAVPFDLHVAHHGETENNNSNSYTCKNKDVVEVDLVPAHMPHLLHCCMICGVPGLRFRETETGYRVCANDSYCLLTAMERKATQIRRVRWRKEGATKLEPSWQWCGAQTRLRFGKLSSIAVGAPKILHHLHVDDHLQHKKKKNHSQHSSSALDEVKKTGGNAQTHLVEIPLQLSSTAPSQQEHQNGDLDNDDLDNLNAANHHYNNAMNKSEANYGNGNNGHQYHHVDTMKGGNAVGKKRLGDHQDYNFLTASKMQKLENGHFVKHQHDVALKKNVHVLDNNHNASGRGGTTVFLQRPVYISVLACFQESSQELDCGDITSTAIVEKVLVKISSDHAEVVDTSSGGGVKGNGTVKNRYTHQHNLHGRHALNRKATKRGANAQHMVRMSLPDKGGKMKNKMSTSSMKASRVVEGKNGQQQQENYHTNGQQQQHQAEAQTRRDDEDPFAAPILGVRKTLCFDGAKPRTKAQQKSVADEIAEYNRELSFLRTAAAKNCRYIIGLVCSYGGGDQGSSSYLNPRAFVMEVGTCDMTAWLREKQEGRSFDIGRYFKMILRGTMEVHRRIGVLNGDVSIENFVYCRRSDTLKTIDLGACRAQGKDCCMYKIQWVEPERVKFPATAVFTTTSAPPVATTTTSTHTKTFSKSKNVDEEDEEQEVSPLFLETDSLCIADVPFRNLLGKEDGLVFSSDGCLLGTDEKLQGTCSSGDEEEDEQAVSGATKTKAGKAKKDLLDEEDEDDEGEEEDDEGDGGLLTFEFNPVTEKSDYWACGIILYKMVFGIDSNPTTDLLLERHLREKIFHEQHDLQGKTSTGEARENRDQHKTLPHWLETLPWLADLYPLQLQRQLSSKERSDMANHLVEDEYGELLLQMRLFRRQAESIALYFGKREDHVLHERFSFQLPSHAAWSSSVRTEEFEPALKCILNLDVASRDASDCERLLPSVLPGEEYSDADDLGC